MFKTSDILSAIFSPFWIFTRFIVSSFLETAPTIIGGWEGKVPIDICTSLLNVPSSLLILDRNQEICNERIKTDIDGKATVVFAIIMLMIIIQSKKIPSLFINAYRAAFYKKKRERAAFKARNTRKENLTNRIIVASIYQIMNLSISSDDKIVAIKKSMVVLDKEALLIN